MQEETNKKDTTDIVPQETIDTQIVAEKSQLVNVEALIGQALNNNVPVETMERLLAMAKEMRADQAKQRFNEAMAKFQSECPTIVKTKSVATNSGVLAYKYAPIESIVEQVKPYLQKNGFSYSTSMEVLQAGVKVSCKVTHIDGHSEVSEMEVPLGDRTNIMSASQVTAAASTFAKRYAFCNAFGILTGDEDNDARPATSGRSNSVPQASPKQRQLIHDLMEQTGLTLDDLADDGITPGQTPPSEVIDYLILKSKAQHGRPNGKVDFTDDEELRKAADIIDGRIA